MREASCTNCKNRRWVNICAWRQGGRDFAGELCAECFDKLPVVPSRNRRDSTAGGNHNDPGFDNVVRAMEEDR